MEKFEIYKRKVIDQALKEPNAGCVMINSIASSYSDGLTIDQAVEKVLSDTKQLLS